MIAFDEALKAVLERARPLPSKPTPIRDAAALAETFFARLDNPRFDNSAVDGYGVRLTDGDHPRALVAAVGAGDTGDAAIGPNEAARVLTGAPIPAGVDAVAMQEDCTVRQGKVVVGRKLRLGENIRRAGEEYRAGDPLLPAGTALTPPAVGLLAANGVESVLASRSPKVAIVATGNELSRPGTDLAAGHIFESNSATLASACRLLGADVAAAWAPDEPGALRDAFEAALSDADVVVTTGGVSVGDRDLAKETLESLGVRRVFWQIAMKPGKPVFFGERGKTLVFGLPGNPVSAWVAFHLLVRPALRQLSGVLPADELWLPARLGRALRKKPGRTEFVRAVLESSSGRLIATPTEGQGSHMMGGAALADALVRIPADVADPKEGERVWALPLRWGTA